MSHVPRHRIIFTFGILLLMLFAAFGCGAQEGRGEELFAENCAVCHGTQADGTNTGPPLVHRLYEPGHHPDFSFQNAIKRGVISHHWDFGDMPPVPGISESEAAQIIAHIRDLQREGGIIKH